MVGGCLASILAGLLAVLASSWVYEKSKSADVATGVLIVVFLLVMFVLIMMASNGLNARAQSPSSGGDGGRNRREPAQEPYIPDIYIPEPEYQRERVETRRVYGSGYNGQQIVRARERMREAEWRERQRELSQRGLREIQAAFPQEPRRPEPKPEPKPEPPTRRERTIQLEPKPNFTGGGRKDGYYANPRTIPLEPHTSDNSGIVHTINGKVVDD